MTPTSVLYHYCAMHQPRSGIGTFNLSDGIVETKADPGTREGWAEIRAQIAGQFVPPIPTGQSPTILSFTRISP